MEKGNKKGGGESSGMPHPRVFEHEVSLMNPIVNGGRAYVLSAQNIQTQTHSSSDRCVWPRVSGHRGLPSPWPWPWFLLSYTTLWWTCLALASSLCFSPNSWPFPQGTFPRVQALGQKLRAFVRSLEHRLQNFLSFEPSVPVHAC